MLALLARYGDRVNYPIDPTHYVKVDTAQPLESSVEEILVKLYE